MRARTARAVNRSLLLVAAGALIAAGGMATAKADPAVDNYVAENSWRVCAVLDHYPTVSGVEGVVLEIIDEGLTPASAGEAVALSVINDCPDHIDEVQAFVDKWSSAKSKSVHA